MRFQVSLFYVGILLIITGSIGAGIILSQSSKSTTSFSLDSLEANYVPVKIKGDGIGYYLISSESYQNNILAKVIDPHGNFLDIRKVTNKVTVDYFHFSHGDQVTLEVTNLSDKPVKITATIGDTRVQEIMFPAILIFGGALVLVFSGYRKLKNYITEQPDENKS
ncbi:exported protein of unknown function [Nitrosotalea devaniterrae]|uniref:Uncharacterized protein n=1 Tax=Nitrosotalea devaniterrae TaxID=1078905 RepID=A0A128A0Z0_9ARCH|nr:exported protein of unknown function [Candidatus Nitrosotalea devanaterra]